MSPDICSSILAAGTGSTYSNIFKSSQRQTHTLHHIANYFIHGAAEPCCIYSSKVVGLFFRFLRTELDNFFVIIQFFMPMLLVLGYDPEKWTCSCRFWMKAVPSFCREHVNVKIRASVSLSSVSNTVGNMTNILDSDRARHESSQQPNYPTMLPYPPSVITAGSVYTVYVYCAYNIYIYIIYIYW